MIRSAKTLGPDYETEIEQYRQDKCIDWWSKCNKNPKTGCYIWLGKLDSKGYPCIQPSRGTVDRNVLGKEIRIRDFIWYTITYVNEYSRECAALDAKYRPIAWENKCKVKLCIAPLHVLWNIEPNLLEYRAWWMKDWEHLDIEEIKEQTEKILRWSKELASGY